MMLDYIDFSIHGSSQDIVIKYQRKGNFQQAYSNMKKLIEYRNSQKYPIINWKYVLFNWNDKEDNITRAIKLAREAKVDSLLFWPTLQPLYGFSWRYYLSSYFKKIGVKFHRGRKIDFRKEK